MSIDHQFVEQAGQSGLPEEERVLSHTSVKTDDPTSTIAAMDAEIIEIRDQANRLRKKMNELILQYNGKVTVRNEAITDTGYSISLMPMANTISIGDIIVS
jgi:uncharacterized protein YoxC